MDSPHLPGARGGANTDSAPGRGLDTAGAEPSRSQSEPQSSVAEVGTRSVGLAPPGSTPPDSPHPAATLPPPRGTVRLRSPRASTSSPLGVRGKGRGPGTQPARKSEPALRASAGQPRGHRGEGLGEAAREGRRGKEKRWPWQGALRGSSWKVGASGGAPRAGGRKAVPRLGGEDELQLKGSRGLLGKLGRGRWRRGVELGGLVQKEGAREPRS